MTPKQKAYEAHEKELKSASIINFVECPCGQGTTTKQTELCKQLNKTQQRAKQVAEGIYQCPCGYTINTKTDSYEEATIGGISTLPHITCPSCKECIGCNS